MSVSARVRLAALFVVALTVWVAGSPLPAAARNDHLRLPHVTYGRQAPAAPAPDAGPLSDSYSAIVIDAASGRVITQAGADIPRYPASLTKLMVLDLAFQALRDGRMTLDETIPVSYHAASVQPVKLGLAPGSGITVRNAILAMTTMSANDAATALGQFLGGGSELRCADMMTLRAHALGMAQTQFFNASGLPNPNQISTARDLAILARDIVVRYPEFQTFFEVQQFDFYGRTVYSNNQMLKNYPGATGLKTGYTILARHNLIASAVRDGRVLIGVELHEPSWPQTYAQMTAMLDDGFAGIPYEFAATPPLAAPLPPPPVHSAPPSAWVAEVGLYPTRAIARSHAVTAQRVRGAGVPRITRVTVHGKVLWRAQLAGLSYEAAHLTCSALAARGSACHAAPDVVA